MKRIKLKNKKGKMPAKKGARVKRAVVEECQPTRKTQSIEE
jgi:hypothetical protein